MKISRNQLIREISKETGFTQAAIKEVFMAMQRLVYTHMKQMDEVRMFDGIYLSGVIKKGHRHHSEYGGDFDMPDYVGPKAIFAPSLRYYIRGLKGYKDYDEIDKEESDD